MAALPPLPPVGEAAPVVATEDTAAPSSVRAAVVVVVVVVGGVVMVALEGREALPIQARKVRGKGNPPGHTSP